MILPYRDTDHLMKGTLVDRYWKRITPELLKKDIQEGDDVNFRYNDKSTPLVNACRYSNDIEIIKILLENGAEIEPEGCTSPLKSACEYSKNPEIVLLLLKYGAEVNPDPIPLRTPLDRLLDNKYLIDTAAHHMLIELEAETGFWGAPEPMEQTGKTFKLTPPKT